ncbi:hypothetical protein F2Q68_00013911 [Brassica cretica]|uniref:Uncharacterized protein n=1 Tax=Brassica cretica TaxID=69181 RepID=A0A8S9HRD4_BRACR|nr:hypothetical protein F2Q68_00013911 [Brassica cretica]
MSIDPFEVKLFGDPACCFLGAMLSACSSSYLSSSEVELDAFLGEIISKSLGFRELDCSRSFCVVLGYGDLILIEVPTRRLFGLEISSNMSVSTSSIEYDGYIAFLLCLVSGMAAACNT